MRRLAAALRVLAAVTAVAGLLGALRQHRDDRRVRRGELPPPATAVGPDPARPPGTPAARLAGWVPPPPRTGPGRLAAGLWAAPLTAPGLAVALLSGARPRWSPAHACWLALGAGGISGAALSWVGADANAIGTVVVARSGAPSPALLAHELVHVRQAERLGVAMLPLYAGLSLRYGYRDHPLERAARLGASRGAGATG